MKRMIALMTAMLAVGLISGSSWAGTDESGNWTNAPNEMTNRTYALNELDGYKVIDNTGAAIGTIKNVNRDFKTDVINFVVIAEPGMGGTGEQLHAVPVTVLQIDKFDKTATLLVSRDMLENAPAQTADVTDEEFKGLIDQYYGVAPAWNEGNGATKNMMQNKEEEKPGMGRYNY